jgi:hypothetical protein
MTSASVGHEDFAYEVARIRASRRIGVHDEDLADLSPLKGCATSVEEKEAQKVPTSGHKQSRNEDLAERSPAPKWNKTLG